MAGSGQRNQSKKSNRQNDRLGPGIGRNSSRVSKVVGGLGSQSVRVEQRSSSPATRQSSRGKSSSRRTPGSKQGAKKGSSPRGNRPAYTPSPPNGTADSRVIDKARDAWGNLEPHHQQRVLSILLLLMALFLFAVLTVFRTVPLFGPLGGAFIALFGWSAYVFAIGLIAFAIAHLIEGIQNKKLIRWSFVVGLVLLWLILLVESQLLLKGKTGGFLGGLLVRPLLGWPEVVGHILLIGLFGVITIVTFQITLGHVLQLGKALRFMASPGQKAAGNTAGSSPYRGQRPRFSRYGSGLNGQQGQVSPDADVDAGGTEDNEGLIEFEADFGDEDDPLNDINIHKQQVSRFPRGSRPAEPLDLEDHSNAVQGVKQQALPFNQAGKAPEKKFPTMEPLAPNPLRKNLSKVLHRGGAQGTAAASESPWKLPDTSLLNNPEEVKLHFMGDDTTTLAKLIQDTLRSFRIEADVRPEDISVGPTVIRFGIRPTGKPAMKLDEKGKPVPIKDASGNIVYEMRTRVSRIMALQNDLALVLEAKSIRMEAPVPGRPYVGVEIPNKNSRLVTLREVLESKEYQSARTKSKIAIALGKDVAGAVRVGDLARMPHLLIAGATGAGKSVCINAIVASILSQATPEDVRLLMVDPKMVELIMYNGIPHLLAPVVTEVEKVVGLLKRAITEMERRYRLFSKLGVRNLDGYRKLRAERIANGDSSLENLPAIVIIIDELADLMMAAPV